MIMFFFNVVTLQGMQEIAKDKEKGLTPQKDEKGEPLRLVFTIDS